MTSQNSHGSGPKTSQTSLDSANQTLSQSQHTGSGSQNDGRVSSTGLSGSDRIYPIRSLVSMNPARGAHALPSPAEEQEEPPHHQPGKSDLVPEATVPITAPDTLSVSRNASSVNDEISSNTPATGDSEYLADSVDPLNSPPQEQPPIDQECLMTSRLQHIFTKNGHSVATEDGSFTVERCEDEPIRTPGAIQSFGVMISLREESPNQLVVRMVSENSQRILGFSPQQLLATESFIDILSDSQRAIFLEHLDYVRDDSYDLVIDGPEVFLLTIKQPSGDDVRFWCATHVSQENKDIIICEFELENDHLNLLNVEDQKYPHTPINTLNTDPPPSEAQYAESTTSASNSVRSIRDARFRKGNAAAMQVFGVLSQIQAQLSQTEDQETLLKVTAGLVKELVGFHRVMVYQFDENANGRVVAELMDPNITMDLFQGLHFPASDIPAQARELYKINKVRLLYDRDHLASRLVCRSLEDLETPLDMSHAYLRAMSPIHNQYLANMKVRSSMSISINAYDDLWGLISCHWYGEQGIRVPFPIRKLCRLVGDTVARNVERISRASDLQARVMMNSVPKEADPSKYIVGSSEDLLQLFQADYGVLSIGSEVKLFGGETVTNTQEVLALVEYIRQRDVTSILASHDINKDFSDFNYPPGLKQISGLLYVPISPNGHEFVIFFRLGQVSSILWAGNPHKPIGGGIGPLTPRQSFKEWRETTLSRSKEWSYFDLSTAGVLGSVYAKFIQVWRQKHILKQNSQLTHLLLANSAHELRTPLNAVVNYLEIAMEGALDEETRENLVHSYTASKSLVYLINDLLDLATEKGQQLIKNESFNLATTIRDAFECLAGEAKTKRLSYTLNIKSGLPDAVLGDERRLRQVLVNLITNSIEHTSHGGVTVKISTSNAKRGVTLVEMSVIDTGSGMSKLTQERLFQELEEVYVGKDLAEEGDEDAISGQNRHVLGTGLALTARLIRILQGQLVFKSKEGQGSRFKAIIGLQTPEDSTELALQDSTQSDLLEMPDPSPAVEREFVLGEADQDGNQQTSEDSIYDDLGLGKSRTIGVLRPRTGPHDKGDVTDQTPQIPLNIAPRIEEIPQESSSLAPNVQQRPAQEHSQDTSQGSTPDPKLPSSDDSKMTILIAEDNPVNSKILEKRLSKAGHTVHLTSNGDACVKAFSTGHDTFHAILMDIQMPIVDGITATKAIREIESKRSKSSNTDENRRASQIPIFAVSASLVERDEFSYIETGFDGWIMKPINFSSLEKILEGVHDVEARKGHGPSGDRDWEKGGWFHIQ